MMNFDVMLISLNENGGSFASLVKKKNLLEEQCDTCVYIWTNSYPHYTCESIKTLVAQPAIKSKGCS